MEGGRIRRLELVFGVNQLRLELGVHDAVASQMFRSTRELSCRGMETLNYIGIRSQTSCR
jgi:hypothetical protein